MLIVVFLVFGGLLPRPSAEFALIHLPWRAESAKIDADKNAFRGDEGGKGDSRRVVKDKNAGKDAATKGNKEEAGKQIQGKAKGKDAAAKKGDGKDKGAADKKNGDVANPKEKGRNEPAKADELADQPPTPILESASEFLAKLAEFLRPILIGIIVLIVLFVVGRALLVFLANFTGWAAGLLNFFRSFGTLFRSEKGEPEEVLEPVSAPPPFAEFTDPFATGTASSMSPAELVRYTFEALEAWAWSRDLGAEPGETPFELAARIGEDTARRWKTASDNSRIITQVSPTPTRLSRTIAATRSANAGGKCPAPWLPRKYRIQRLCSPLAPREDSGTSRKPNPCPFRSFSQGDTVRLVVPGDLGHKPFLPKEFENGNPPKGHEKRVAIVSEVALTASSRPLGRASWEDGHFCVAKFAAKGWPPRNLL